MTPSPYQSKLLRLAIAQYRNGLDRHRRAFRRARSTTIATVEIGTALALVPVFTMVQISQAVGQRLQQSVKKRRMFGFGHEDANRLNFSGFNEATLATSAPSGSDKATTAERSMVKTLRAVGGCLSLDQIKLLSKMDGAIQPLKARVLAKLTDKGRVISVHSQITGVASDLETRSLLLVIGYSQVWNGLSANQQMQLQSQIDRFLPSVGKIQTVQPSCTTVSTLNNKIAVAVSIKQNVLTQPLRSFWIEVLSAIAWMKQRYHRAKSAARLTSGRDQIEGGGFRLQGLPDVHMSDVDLGAIALNSDNAKNQKGQPYYLDVDVIMVGYVEHPLEKLLKWVDRILLWLEDRWNLVRHKLGL